jgi:hypothetical protein
MEDKEILIRQTVLMETMSKQITAMGEDIKEMKENSNGHSTKTAVLEEKVTRLEKIVYGALGVIIAQIISIVILWLQK